MGLLLPNLPDVSPQLPILENALEYDYSWSCSHTYRYRDLFFTRKITPCSSCSFH